MKKANSGGTLSLVLRFSMSVTLLEILLTENRMGYFGAYIFCWSVCCRWCYSCTTRLSRCWDILVNVVTEGILITEQAIKREKIGWAASATNVVTNTIEDQILGIVYDPIADTFTRKIDKSVSKNYSSLAGKLRKKNPNLMMHQTKKKMYRTATLCTIAECASTFALDLAENTANMVLFN